MFNFKKAFTLGLAGAALAVGISTVAPTKANAGTCWNLEANARNVEGYYCQTQRRVNANGHVVWDIIEGRTKTTLVFWDDNVVEIIGLTERPIQRPFYTDRDGDIRIDLPGGAEFAIRL